MPGLADAGWLAACNGRYVMGEIDKRLSANAVRLHRQFDALLDGTPQSGEERRPARLVEAMRYAVLGGGKAIRASLMMETARRFGRGDDGVVRAALALECVHSYSLIHDDLPAMDDDAMRRGKPTVHIAFDEATAILAGDALLTLAFDVMTHPQIHQNPQIRLDLVRELSRAAGLGGMAGGQMLDCMAGEHARDLVQLQQIHDMKTGALFRFAGRAGAILTERPEAVVCACGRFGQLCGRIFQATDDLLDLQGDAGQMGKAAQKDSAAGRPNMAGLLGIGAARSQCVQWHDEARRLLAGPVLSATMQAGPCPSRSAGPARPDDRAPPDPDDPLARLLDFVMSRDR